MQPQDFPPAPPPMQPGGPNPYDFLQDAPKPKRSLIPSGGSLKQRLLIVAGGAVILIIIIAVLASALTAGSSSAKTDLILASQQQAELIRVAEIGVKDSRGADAKTLAINTQLTMESDKLKFAPIAGKVDKKTLALSKNTKTDTTLTHAQQTNNFDGAFIVEIKRELTDYQTTLKRIHDKTTNTKNKAVIAELYEHAGMLAGAKE